MLNLYRIFAGDGLALTLWLKSSRVGRRIILFLIIQQNLLTQQEWHLNTIINYYKMENLVAKIKEEINVFVENADAQVVKGNKAAGARARKAALELMKDLKEFRKVSVEESKK